VVDYRTADGDMLDNICFNHYGASVGMVEQVLKANPGLAAKGPVFVSGIVIMLPDLKPQAQAAPVRLWD